MRWSIILWVLVDAEQRMKGFRALRWMLDDGASMKYVKMKVKPHTCKESNSYTIATRSGQRT